MKPATDLTDREPAEVTPDAVMLATIAAQSRFQSMTPKDAAEAALHLWHECQMAIDAKRRLDQAERKRKKNGIPMPRQFPATREDFYRLIVRAKNMKDREPRFRRFLLWDINYQRERKREQTFTEGSQAAIAAVDESFAGREFFTFDKEWDYWAVAYRNWWEAEQRGAKEAAGRLGAVARKKKVSQIESTLNTTAAIIHGSGGVGNSRPKGEKARKIKKLAKLMGA